MVSFDARVALGPSDRFVPADIEAMNSVMATRTKAATLLAKAEAAVPRLELLDPTWSMTTMPESEWSRDRVTVKIGAAVRAFGATWPNIAVVTKLLYLKRPDLVPIIGSYIVDHLGRVDGVKGAVRTFR